ncbi:MAG: MotA/TolQ/ExbB proton channel family protein [Gemmatimonadales bacterium]
MASIWDFFFSPDPARLIGTAVNIAIVAIGSAGLLELFRALHSLRVAQTGLDGFARQIREQDPPPDRIAVIASAVSPSSLMARRVGMLEALLARGADIDTSAFAATAVSELDREAKWTRWAASNVVLFGLGGTLIGLSQAVVSALPLLREIISVPQAGQAVLDTFQGLSTAFSTTLMGIIWAVILSASLSLFRHRQQRFLQALEEVSQIHLYPRFRTSPALAMVEAARTLSALEKAIGKELAELVGQVRMQGMALTKTVEDSIDGMVSQFRTTADGLRQSTEDSLGSVVQETKERGLALTTTVDRSVAALTAEIRESNAASLAQVTAIAESIHRLVGTPGAEAPSLAAILGQLDQGVQAIHRSSERMVQLVPSLEEAIARQVDRQSRDLHETMHAYTGKLGGSLDRQDALIGTGFDRLEKGVGGFGDLLLTQLQTHDTQLLEGVGRKLEPVGALLAQQVNHLAEMRQIAEGLVSAASGLDRRSDDIGRAMGEVRHSAGALAHQLEQVGESMDALGKALNRTASSPAQVATLIDGRAGVPPAGLSQPPLRSQPAGPAVAPVAPQAAPPPTPAPAQGGGGDGLRVPPATRQVPPPQPASSPGPTPAPISPPPAPAAQPAPPRDARSTAPSGASERSEEKKGSFWARLFGWK